MNQHTALEAEVRALRAEVQRLGARLEESTETAESFSRRALLTKLGGAALAGAGVAAAGSVLTNQPAGATQQTMFTGFTNNADDVTTLQSNINNPVLWVNNYGGHQALLGTGGVGVRGESSGPATVGGTTTAGIVGTSGPNPGVVANSDDHVAVIATSKSSVALQLNAGTNRGQAWLVPQSFRGGPTTGGPHALGEVLVDSEGTVLINKFVSSPGSFQRVGFNPITPYRLVDTRNTGGPIGEGVANIRQFTVSGTGTSPNNVPPFPQAQSVVLNVTAVDATNASYLTVFPSEFGFAGPDAPFSNVNFGAGQTQANQCVVKLGRGGAHDGKIKVFNAHGAVQVVLDVLGYFA